MKKILNFLKSIHYEMILFFILFLDLLSRAPHQNKLPSWPMTPYALSYRFGFGSRFLIGSIIRLFTDFTSKKIVWYFIFIFLVILIILIAALLGRVLRSSTGDVRSFLICAITLYFASPASISYLFNWINFGQFEMYHMILVLLVLCCANKKIIKWLVPLICILAVPIHQAFLFTFAPLVFLILFYEIYKNNFSKESIILFSITILVTGTSFLIFQFTKNSLNMPFDKMIIDAFLSTDLPIEPQMINYEYFIPLVENFSHFLWEKLGKYALPYILSLVLISPIGFILYKFWKQCIKSAQNKKIKLIFKLAKLLPLCSLPLFMLTSDWGRWFATIIISQFTFIIYLIYSKEKSIEHVCGILTAKFKKHWQLFLAFLIYLTVLGKFGLDYPLVPISSKITQLINLFPH